MRKNLVDTLVVPLCHNCTLSSWALAKTRHSHWELYSRELGDLGATAYTYRIFPQEHEPSRTAMVCKDVMLLITLTSS